jgi:hypothetical protein
MRMMSQKEQPHNVLFHVLVLFFSFLLITFENLSSRSITTRDDDDDDDEDD